ncbi:endonuclease/exonuclease/phosphatase family protein [Rhodobacteraceae bacterium KMS-5]|uniref:Endonuclease/exonuclease/phosphatase family protein n=1 Tax=Tabrizicola oligotrophica TaxID=2710650 RepID=A0A6M0QRZ3_9RHOB|nr:endonuclease/exonuclease/phosphatase family protein [Tabrizicola oligotrophica]
MGLSTCKLVHARHCHGTGRRHDSGTPQCQPRAAGRARRACRGLIAAFAAGLWALGASAETLRIATYNADLSAPGPGLLLFDLRKKELPAQRAAVVEAITALDADVLLLTGIDFDLGGEALGALADRLEAAGLSYPHRIALRPNTGVPTGRDLDGNGQLGEARDAQGWGRFPGEGGMAVLSRLPLGADGRDFSTYLWADLQGNLMPDTDPARDVQRLHTTGAHEVPVLLPDGRTLRLLAFYASPPAFDGPEDRNGRRNHDEAAFWLRLLAGDLPLAPPEPPFVILGQTSLDPEDGGGRPEALRALLSHPALQDPAPRGQSGREDPGQQGDPALDTALYDDLGGLRVEVILPSADLPVAAAGVLGPPEEDEMARTLATASRHRPVWVDLRLP